MAPRSPIRFSVSYRCPVQLDTHTAQRTELFAGTSVKPYVLAPGSDGDNCGTNESIHHC